MAMVTFLMREPKISGAFTWPQFSSALDNSLQFDTTLSVITGVGNPECNYWDSRIGATYVLPTAPGTNIVHLSENFSHFQ